MAKARNPLRVRVVFSITFRIVIDPESDGFIVPHIRESNEIQNRNSYPFLPNLPKCFRLYSLGFDSIQRWW